MLNAAAVLLCTSVAAATQNTVATVLRYRSMTSGGCRPQPDEACSLG